VPYEIYRADNEALVAALRDAMGENDFDAAWAEGAALSTVEAIAYAQRGRGERKRPSTGWASSPQPNWTWSGSSVRAWATRTSPQGFSSRHAPSKPTSPTSTPSSVWRRASNLPRRRRVAPERIGAATVVDGTDRLCDRRPDGQLKALVMAAMSK
jgi:hypothetical protein